MLLVTVAGCSYEQRQASAAIPAVGLFVVMEMLSVDPPGHAVSLGWEAVAGTEFRDGHGPCLDIRGFGGRDMGQISVSVVKGRVDPQREQTRYSATIGIWKGERARRSALAVFFGPAWHVGNGNDWGVGWTYGLGWGATGKHAEFLMLPLLYGWLGEDRDDSFAVGALAALRIVAGVRF